MDEQNPTAAPQPAKPDPPPVADEVSLPAASLPEPALTVAELEAARERERWLRERFEKEHQVTLALMRLLLAGLSGQGRLMRFWRWLIDDFRSEKRILADPHRESSEERILVNRVLIWAKEQGFFANRPGSGSHAEGSGQ
jgi:hypothetical protein